MLGIHNFEEIFIGIVGIQSLASGFQTPGECFPFPGASTNDKSEERVMALSVEACAYEHDAWGLPASLANSYILLRHGQSKANELGIIVSDREHGVDPLYGLTPLGAQQAAEAGRLLDQFLCTLQVPKLSVVILSSPFSRALETAQELRHVLDSWVKGDIQIVEGLRERYFGPALELGPHDKYEGVWEEDAVHPDVGPEGGESVVQVAQRVAQVMCSVEALHSGCVVVLTSHGDTLQVAHALCKGAGLLNSPPCSSSSCSRTKETLLGELGRHRENALANCEWRLLAHSRLNAEAL